MPRKSLRPRRRKVARTSRPLTRLRLKPLSRERRKCAVLRVLRVDREAKVLTAKCAVLRVDREAKVLTAKCTVLRAVPGLTGDAISGNIRACPASRAPISRNC